MKLTVNSALVRGILVGLTGYTLLLSLQGLLYYTLTASDGARLDCALFAGQLALIIMHGFLLFALLKKPQTLMPLIFTLFITLAALNIILPAVSVITNLQHLEPVQQFLQFVLVMAQLNPSVSFVAVWLAWLLYRASKPATDSAI
ncbi:MAG: hypothetical protein LBK71_08115 [Verrucomicrobiales bacterium]|jgi:hypothetical protein|nr:hypothetical protein [Verrucomicrobiales bacterium]